MPIIDGEKYACQSCIKGHRVSGCQHVDRELTHINPKGRPVKQCEHCRGARKAKSHHARCDCGSKKDKDSKDKAKSEPGEESGCCCYNGSKCTCGLKKEPMTLKLDTSFQKQAQHNNRSKPRLTSTHSEPHLTVFANGHHKPCHRLNNSAHTSGAPYKIPRPHTHGPTSGGHHSHSASLGHFSSAGARRSTDDLGLGDASSFAQYSASVDSLPLNTLPEHEGRGDVASIFYGQPPSTSTAASDHSSPIDVQSADAFGFAQWPWSAAQMSQTPIGQYSLDGLSTSPTTADYLSTFDNDFAIPSAGLNPTPLWSAGDLPLDTGNVTKALTPPLSLSGDSNRPSVPGMTSGSSGAQSEAGDPVCLADSDVMNSQSSMAESYLFDDGLTFRRTERPGYRLNAVAKWPEYRQPPTSVPATDSRSSVDLDSLKRARQGIYSDASPTIEPEKPYSSMAMDAKALVYTGGPPDFKPTGYPSMGNAPRSMTMPSSPAETYTELTSWPSSLSLSGAPFELPGEDYNFNNTVDLANYGYLS